MAAEKLSQVQELSAPLHPGTKIGASAGGLADVSSSEFRICSRVCVVNETRTNELPWGERQSSKTRAPPGGESSRRPSAIQSMPRCARDTSNIGVVADKNDHAIVRLSDRARNRYPLHTLLHRAADVVEEIGGVGARKCGRSNVVVPCRDVGLHDEANVAPSRHPQPVSDVLMPCVYSRSRFSISVEPVISGPRAAMGESSVPGTRLAGRSKIEVRCGLVRHTARNPTKCDRAP